MKTFADVVTTRRSCRAFRPDPLDDATLLALFELAQHTPSWCNTQSWHTAVTRPPTTIALVERLRDWSSEAEGAQSDLERPDGYPAELGERRRAAGHALYAAVGIERGDMKARSEQAARNLELFGAPHVAIVTARSELADYGILDAGAYLATLLLAATSMDIATIPLGSLARFAPQLREHLALPDTSLVVCGVALGYADGANPAAAVRTARADVPDAVTFL